MYLSAVLLHAECGGMPLLSVEKGAYGVYRIDPEVLQLKFQLDMNPHMIQTEKYRLH